jgi:hypothetical protein
MRYPDYRQAGLPVTTAWMESLVKGMNHCVKGSEMFWNDPGAAEAILQLRAASLCDDDRLIEHLRSRPGYPFTVRPRSPKFVGEKIRSCRAPNQQECAYPRLVCRERAQIDSENA